LLWLACEIELDDDQWWIVHESYFMKTIS
jgi:hypothetical protein